MGYKINHPSCLANPKLCFEGLPFSPSHFIEIMKLHFILVEPAVPENVGAAARALKTMGFNRLRLVNSRAHREPAAQWLAHGATEVLNQVVTFPDLSSALLDIDLVVGTSAKKRLAKREVYTPDRVLHILQGRSAELSSNAGLVFGPESRGLSGEEIDLCDIVSSIPLAQAQPSLNLGQAVMLYAYELSALTNDRKIAFVPDQDSEQLRALQKRLHHLFLHLDKVPGSALEQWAFERTALATTKDIHFLHSLCLSLEKAISVIPGPKQ